MFRVILINFLICVTLMHFSTDTSMQVVLHPDKHLLTGMINLLISLQLGMSIKYLVNKLPLAKLAIMYEPEWK